MNLPEFRAYTSFYNDDNSTRKFQFTGLTDINQRIEFSCSGNIQNGIAYIQDLELNAFDGEFEVYEVHGAAIATYLPLVTSTLQTAMQAKYGIGFDEIRI